ncbi:ABC transporter substrate-binding protein [bacterium]|nr:ABC transporter substrate-binding protein [bacterium]
MTDSFRSDVRDAASFSEPPVSRLSAVLATVVALLGLLSLTWWGRAAEDRLVVYCAHDSVYSEEVLRDFERETGIPVEIRFDTEATKSLGLVSLLVAERDRPRCDVFWNNEVLGTMKLKEHGVLEPYTGTGYERIPQRYRDPDGYWTGFGARLRVSIVNTDRLAATDEVIAAAFDSGDLSRIAVATPLYGTTLTHYSVLWQQWGEERLKQWHADVHNRGIVEVKGNAVVKNLVAAGKCDLGWTDTDDFFLAVDDGAPVEMRPVRAPSGETICIPNSVAIVRRCRHRKLAERLVDYLLSEEVELRLAKSRSRQVPLGAVNESRLPEQVRQSRPYVAEGVDLNAIAEAHRECLDWLRSEYSE